MPYEVELPNGTIVEGIPDDMPRDEVRKKLISAYPDLESYKPQATPAPDEGRGFIRSITDPIVGAIKGVGDVAQLPGKFQDLVLGSISPEALAAVKGRGTGIQGAGKELSDYAQSLKSQQQQGLEKQVGQKASEAYAEAGGGLKGMAYELYTTLKEVGTNPSMLPTFLAEMAPNMAGPLVAGKGIQVGTKLLFKDISTKALASAGVTGAIGTGAIMQGTDVGYEAYEDTFKKLVASGVSEEEAIKQAIDVGQDAALRAAAVSVVAQLAIPGGRSLERAVLSGGAKKEAELAARAAGKPVKREGYVKPIAGETGSEGFEEGFGKYQANLAQQAVLPNQDPYEGVGTNTGYGMIGALGTGTVAGAINRARQGPEVSTEGATLGATPPAPEAELSPEALAGLQPATITSSSGPVTVSYPNPNAGQPMPPPDGAAPLTQAEIDNQNIIWLEQQPTTEAAPVDYRGFPAPPTDLPAGVQPAAPPTEPEPDTSKTFPAIERGVEGATLPNVEFGDPGGMHNAIAQRLRASADTLGISPLIYDKLQQGKSVKQIANDLKAKLTFLPESGRTNFVNQVHKTFGPVERIKAEETAPVETTTDAQDVQSFEPQTPGAVQGPALPKVNIGESPTDMVNKVAQTMRREADQKGLTAYIADQSAKGRSAKQIANSYGFASKLEFLPPEQRHNYVRQVQATLGYGPIAQRWGVNVNQPTVPSRGRKSTKASSQPAGVDTTVKPTVVDEGGVGGVDNPPADTTTGKTTEPPTLTKRAPRKTKLDKLAKNVIDSGEALFNVDTDETAPTETAPRDVISDLDLNPPEDTPAETAPSAKVPRPADVIIALVDGMNNGLEGVKNPAIRELLKDKYLVDKKGLTPKGRRFLNEVNGRIPDPVTGFERPSTNEEAQESFNKMFSKADLESTATKTTPAADLQKTAALKTVDNIQIALTEATFVGVNSISDPNIKQLLIDKYLINNKTITPKGTRFLNTILLGSPEEALEAFTNMLGSEDLGASRESVKGKAGVNQRRLTQMTGQSMYGKPERTAPVAIKEMLQNAFDAVKPLIENGTMSKGNIDINLDPQKRTITVLDDGLGMSADSLAGPFLKIAETEKHSERNSGGFGIAKAQFLYSAATDTIKVYTLHEGVVSVLDTTSAELRATQEEENPGEQPDINIYRKGDPEHTRISKMFPKGHGTFVELKINEKYLDPSDQGIKDIPMSDNEYEYPVLLNSPLFSEINVKFNGYQLSNIGSSFSINDYDHFGKGIVKFPTFEATIYVNKKERQYPSNSTRILSNGIWQFSTSTPKNPNKPFGKELPYDIYIDVNPTVKPDQAGYPFALNRQSFNEAANNSLQTILKYISIHYAQKSLDADTIDFGNLDYIGLDKKTGNINYVKATELTPKIVAKAIAGLNNISNDVLSVDNNGKLFINGKEVPILTADDIKNIVIDTSELEVDPKLIDPNKIILHNNFEVHEDPNNLNSPFVNLVEHARKKFGQRFDDYVYGVGEAFQELRDVVSDMMSADYVGLRQEPVGVSFGDYRGVSIKLPFSGAFINPALPRYTDTERAASGMVGTMTHELAHHLVRSHDENFPAAMQDILLNLETSKTFNFNEFKTNFENLVREHQDILDFLRKSIPTNPITGKINEKHIRFIGSKFKNGSYQSLASSSTGNVVGNGAKGRGQSGLPIQTQPSSGATGQQQVNTGVPAKSKRAGQPGPLSINSSNPTFNPLAKANAPVGKEGGYRETPFGLAARKIANWHQPIRSLENVIDLSGKLVYSGADVNAFATILAAASAKGVNYYRGNMANLVESIHAGINDYAKSAGISIDKALENMHLMAEALHEPERRAVKYLLTVPLDTAKNLTQNGKAISAADRRNDIMNLLNKYKLTEAQAKTLRSELDSLVANHADPLGYSPRRDAKNGGVTGAMPVDINAEIYKVSVMEASDVARITQEYNADKKNKVLIDAILDNTQKLNKRVLDANKISNYVSDPVANRIAFYGWTDYVPLKGFNEHPAKSPIDDEIDIFAGSRLSKELQETEFAFDARDTVSNNPITQVTVEAIRASARAGRGSELTLSIMNAVEQGFIKGKIEKNIPFEEREEALKDALKKNVVLHYNKDGSVDVIRVYDELILNSLRRSYNDISPLWNAANFLTSTVGKSMTRWNYTFAPMNYVRDILTNAWLMAVEGNPIEAAKFLATVAARTITNPHTATRVAYLYENNKFAELNALAKRSGFARDMIEYIENGGMQSYSDTMSVGNKVKALEKKLGRGLVLKTSDEFSKVIDIYNNVFELTSRAAAYGVMKSKYMHGSRKMSAKDAAIKAAMEVKNYANFEQVGERGRELGALFMFGRATATGATRALESIAPAFDLVLPPQWKEANKLPKSIRDDPAALATFKKNFRKKQLSSTIMVGGLIGAGMYLFGMIAAGAPEDELGRNKVLTDDLDQWTRYLRMPVADGKFPESMGKNVVFQMPFGLGNGAFVGVGVQIAANDAGIIDKKQMFKNISTILLDAFLPFPTSKMDISKNPAQFAFDTATPTVIRTMTQAILNKDGLGRDIVPPESSGNKMGAAYSGSESTPQMYKDAAMALANIGGPNINPNSLLHFFTNYVNGIAKIAEEAYDMLTPPDQRKAFNPHKDMGPLSSFFGTPSSVDARNFSKLRDEMDDITKRTNMFKLNPQKRNEYEVTNNGYIVSMWEKDLNGQLKALQSQANLVRKSTIGEFTPAQREIILKDNAFAQNLVKKNLIEKYKQLGVKF